MIGCGIALLVIGGIAALLVSPILGGFMIVVGLLVMIVGALQKPEARPSAICSNCGNPVARTANICPTCQIQLIPSEGPLAPPKPTPPEQSPEEKALAQKSTIRGFIIMGGILVVAVVILIVMSNAH